MHSFIKDVSAYQVTGTGLVDEDKKMKTVRLTTILQSSESERERKYLSMHRILQMFTEEYT